MKVLHIFWINEPKFLDRMYDITRQLNEDNHFMLILYEEQYLRFKNDEYVFFDNRDGYKFDWEIINKYASIFDFLFMHGMCKHIDFLLVKNQYLRKIVWRTWGGNIGYSTSTGDIKSYIKCIVNWIYFKKLSRVRMIGYANVVDVINLKKDLHNVNNKMIRMPYSISDNLSLYSNIRKNIQKHQSINVLLGHSGYPVMNHLEILNRLSSYLEHDIKIYLVLSYGDSEYIEKVLASVETLDIRSKIVIIRDFLSYEEYLKLLGNIDIAIFDGTISYALGNITPLVYFNKKIYLDPRGVIAQAFIKENIQFGDINVIGDESFTQFSSSIDYSGCNTDEFMPHSYQENLQQWKKIMNLLRAKDTHVEV